MFRYSTLASALIAIAAICPPNLFAAASGVPRAKLPPGFEVLNSFEASASQAAAISRKLGGKIDKLANTVLSVHGTRLQVNVIICSTAADTEKVHKSVLSRKDHPAFCYTFGKTVVEFVGDDVAVAIMAGFELGYKPKPKDAAYKISFEAGPMESGDYMSWNKLFNLFLESDKNPGNLAFKARIELLSKQFRFGHELTLRTLGTPEARPSYSFKPEAVETTPLSNGELTRYTFDELPEKSGVPFVSIAATVRTTASTGSATTRKAGPELLQATEFWPSNDPKIIALARKITVGCSTEQQKVAALLKWLRPGVYIKFAGPVIGSRYGVKETLIQEFGNCWDFSDCFITFCRALKIPARQVAGWLYGQSGHIWAEVLVENNQWRQVDPTGGGIVGCGIYHIAYLTSEDGKMPILYLSQPKIEFLNY